MKMIQKMRFAAVAAGALLLGATYATPARAATIRVDPVLQAVGFGSSAAVDIMLDLAAGESTGGYTFGLAFDATILSPNLGLTAVNTAPFDNSWDPAPLFSVTPVAGRLDFFMLSFAGLDPVGPGLPAQGSGFRLARVVFDTGGLLLPGTSFVTPTLIPGGSVSNGDGLGLLPTTLEGGCITVAPVGTNLPAPQDCRQPVPEPGTLSLIGLGVAGLAAAARRRARA